MSLRKHGLRMDSQAVAPKPNEGCDCRLPGSWMRTVLPMPEAVGDGAGRTGKRTQGTVGRPRGQGGLKDAF